MTEQVKNGKEQFTEHLQNLMEILETSKKENDYIRGADITKKLLELYDNIEENEYYEREFSRDRTNTNHTRNILSDKQKLESEDYKVCKYCNRFIHKYRMNGHLKTKICRDIRIAKFTSKRQNEANFVKYKIYDLIIFNHLCIIEEDSSIKIPDMYKYYNDEEESDE